MSTFLCRFQVWFALHTFQVSHWHIFPQSEVQLPLIEPDWAAYCVWGVLNRSSWCLSQFPEQCVCKNPACVTSAPFSLASKVAAVQRGRGSQWKHLLQHRPCPQSALFQPVWSNCWRSVSTYPPPFFFSYMDLPVLHSMLQTRDQDSQKDSEKIPSGLWRFEQLIPAWFTASQSWWAGGPDISWYTFLLSLQNKGRGWGP